MFTTKRDYISIDWDWIWAQDELVCITTPMWINKYQ